jgi:hypothetical protein
MSTLDKLKSGELEIVYERWDKESLYCTLRAPKSYPSAEAMKAAVELEIHAALGKVQTITIGAMIQKAIDASLSSRSPQACVEEEK